MKIHKSILIALIIVGSTLISCDKEDVIEQIIVVPAETTLIVDTRVGDEDFSLNKNFSIDGTDYQFEKLRYWISNIVLINENGTEYPIKETYFLMEEVGNLDLSGTINDNNIVYPANKREEIALNKIPDGFYKNIRFSVGVDAQYNDNLSLQAGELSIANGMSNISWMWHTSYIFSSIGGKATDSSSSKQTSFIAETGLNENYKSVSIALASPLEVKAGTSSKLTLNLDIAKVLEEVDVITTPVIGAQQPEIMKKISNNFSEKAFSFSSVE